MFQVSQAADNRCPEHQGVKWIPFTAPCFLCDPGWWDENPPKPMVVPPADPRADDIETLVRETIASGHWGPPQDLRTMGD